MRHSTRWPLRPSARLLLCLSLLLTTGTVFAQVPGLTKPLELDGVVLTDGVVLDAAREALYFMSPDGGIDAVDLSGSVLWSTDVAAKPLFVTGSRLVAQAEPNAAGELELVVLDGATGGETGRLRAALPDGVWSTIDHGPRRSFTSRMWRQGDELLVSWLSTKTAKGKLQGYLPSREEEAVPDAPSLGSDAKTTSIERLNGAFALDLDGIRADALAPEKLAAMPAAAELKEVALFRDADGRQFLSADGRHVLVSARAGQDWSKSYRWSLYTQAGELVGRFDHHTAVAPFVVIAGKLVFESRPFLMRRGEDVVDRALEVVVVDLASGAELWTKSLREVEFEGPFPP